MSSLIEDFPPEPEFDKVGVPLRSERCQNHDGKRCKLIGFKPDRICEPSIWLMIKELEELKR